MSFDSLGLGPKLVSALRELGIDTPTSVQSAAIPQALAGHDLMVSSQTGSGKTAAFMLPALEHLSHTMGPGGRGVRVLVLAPTRELAMQVADATKGYGKHLDGLRVATVVGGMPYGAQIKSLSRRVDVLVATPGRLIDHLQAGRVKLSTVETLVLDEADRMLDMGFIEDIETIVGATSNERQTLLFSATLDGTVAKLAANLMHDPKRIEIASAHQKHTNITQHLLYADDRAHKLRLLDHLLRDTTLDQAIVFTATKRGADDLAEHLADEGFATAALHGDMNQRQRTRTLGLLQKGRVRVLVATDVAARGIDVQTITHAVNYDLPMQAEDYVHRIGRTGRAGRDGQAITLAVTAERHKIRRIEQFIGQSIPTETIPGLEPQRAPRPTWKDRPSKGRPHSGKPGGYQGKPGGYQGRKPWQQERDDAAPRAGGDKPWQRDGGDSKPWHKANDAAEGGKPWHKSRDAAEGGKPWHKSRDVAGGDKPWQKARDAAGSKPWHKERDGGQGFAARPARKPWERDERRSDDDTRPARAPRHAHGDHAERSARGDKPGFKSDFKPGFKRQARQGQDKKPAARPRFA
ncbi:DEAD/DEAH box helicase [Castellaniella caeni]|uniref:DEAD/DEAH box helicase n=1 Tax=Castellaniella caeni TaxID=266123 RepID=UPI00082A434C|nr:DEAD/DEAH box helicase [Castellaniella caeni]